MVDAQSMWCGPGEQRRSWVKVATSAALDLMLPIERCLKITLKKKLLIQQVLYSACVVWDLLRQVQTGPDLAKGPDPGLSQYHHGQLTCGQTFTVHLIPARL